MKWIAAAGAVLLIAAVAVLTGNGGNEGNAQEAEAPERAAYTRTCTRTNDYPFYPADKKRDALLGRVRIGAFRGNFENAEPGNVYQPKPGLFDLKAPIVFPGRRDVTLSVPEEYRPVLRLGYRRSGHKGYSSVRFRSCTRRSDRITGYSGGLRYTGPWPACVPIDVTVGSSATRRYVLSLGAGRCETPG